MVINVASWAELKVKRSLPSMKRIGVPLIARAVAAAVCAISVVIRGARDVNGIST